MLQGWEGGGLLVVGPKWGLAGGGPLEDEWEGLLELSDSSAAVAQLWWFGLQREKLELGWKSFGILRFFDFRGIEFFFVINAI